MAPGSSPPWPGSSATMIRRSTSRRARSAGRRPRAPAWSVRTPGRRGAAPLPARSMRPMNSPSASRTACVGALLGLLLVADQRQQRVALLQRVQVEHQPVLVGRHRREREQLRRDRLLQVDHQPHHARLVLADAHAGDVGVVGAHLADQLAQLGLSSSPSMSTTSRGGLSVMKCLAASDCVGLDRHARVVGGRPDAHRDDAGAVGELAAPTAAAPARRLAAAGPPGVADRVMRAAPRRAACRRAAATSRAPSVARRDAHAQVGTRQQRRGLVGPLGELQARAARRRRESRRRPTRAGRRSGRSRSATPCRPGSSYGSSTRVGRALDAALHARARAAGGARRWSCRRPAVPCSSMKASRSAGLRGQRSAKAAQAALVGPGDRAAF